MSIVKRFICQIYALRIIVVPSKEPGIWIVNVIHVRQQIPLHYVGEEAVVANFWSVRPKKIQMIFISEPYPSPNEPYLMNFILAEIYTTEKTSPTYFLSNKRILTQN